MILQKRLDELAVLYNKTKNERYKKLWYKLIREAYGSNNTRRWTVSINTSYKENVRRDNFNRKNRLFRVV
tara:strand:- start:437 stop:646 length:210 start_codon:yes stop_codon:yes gene_type:complete